MDDVCETRYLKGALYELKHFKVLFLNNLRKRLKIIPELLLALVNTPVRVLVLSEKRAAIRLLLLIQLLNLILNTANLFLEGIMTGLNVCTAFLFVFKVGRPREVIANASLELNLVFFEGFDQLPHTVERAEYRVNILHHFLVIAHLHDLIVIIRVVILTVILALVARHRLLRIRLILISRDLTPQILVGLQVLGLVASVLLQGRARLRILF